jgi:hypothetical protein
VGELRALAREHTKAALEALVEIVGSKKAPPAARVAAANAILDRGYGRPETKIDATLEQSNSAAEAPGVYHAIQQGRHSSDGGLA